MVDSISRNIPQIFSLLTEYDFQFDEIPKELRCVHCEKIVNDACQVGCGCRFCRICIDILIAKGQQTCPGGTDDCRGENIGEFQSDLVGNKKVARLTVRCPKCNETLRLVEMRDHLSTCGLDNVETAKAIAQLRLAVAHLQRSEESQRAEIDILQSNNDNHRNEFESLTKQLKVALEEIHSLGDRVRQLELNNEGEKVEVMKNIVAPPLLEGAQYSNESISFRWPVGSLGNGMRCSDIFGGPRNSFRLEMDVRVTHLVITLHCIGGCGLNWPLKAHVTMKLIDQDNLCLLHTADKHIVFAQSTAKYCEPFAFPLFDPNIQKMLEKFIVECSIKCE